MLKKASRFQKPDLNGKTRSREVSANTWACLSSLPGRNKSAVVYFHIYIHAAHMLHVHPHPINIYSLKLFWGTLV